SRSRARRSSTTISRPSRGLATQFGYAAAAMEADVVYGILTGNPVMADTYALFSTQHANLAPPAGIDLASMTAAPPLMAAPKTAEGTRPALTPVFPPRRPPLQT